MFDTGAAKATGSIGVSTRYNEAHFLDQLHSLQIALAFTMATNDESTTCSSQNVAASLVTVELDENDIPGAALSAPLERHTVPQLKWWLP